MHGEETGVSACLTSHVYLVSQSCQAKPAVLQTALIHQQYWGAVLNVYVKDAFRLRSVMENAENIYHALSGIGTKKRIDKAIRFLLAHGYLRKTMDGKIVEDTPLTISDTRLPSRNVRQFHKKTLEIAKQALDAYPIEERVANALVLPLDEDGYRQLGSLIEEFAERLQQFAADQRKPGKRLYQILINLSPTGGEKHD